MTSERRDLGRFFNPRSIAIVGVSKGGFRFGGTSFLKKLKKAGFPGKIFPINPKASEIESTKAYPDLSSLPPELAQAVRELLAALG